VPGSEEALSGFWIEVGDVMAQWLIRKTGSKVKAHIWNGRDTACRMASTGGLKLDRFEVRQDRGTHEVCHMCRQNDPAEINRG